MWQMSKLTSRIAAVGLLVAAIAAPLFGVLLPVIQRFQDLSEAIEEQRQQLGSYLAVADQQADLRALEQQRRAELGLGEFLAGNGELAVQASLQTALSGIAQASGVRLRSTRKLAERERGPVRLAGMGLNLTAEIEGLQKLLHGIETARPYLFVEAADLSPLGGANPPLNVPRLIEIRLDIFAALDRSDQP
jgi:hypothetical protein